VTLAPEVIVCAAGVHAMVAGSVMVYVIDVLLAPKLALPAYDAVIVWASVIGVVGGVVDGEGCVPPVNADVVAVTTPLALTVTAFASVVAVVVSVIVVVPLVAAAPPAVTVVVAVNTTDAPYPSWVAGLAVSVVVVGAAAADPIAVCPKNAMVSANKTLMRASSDRLSDCAETKAETKLPF
jgi:mRNA-degrading endonuclease toxin of MazEF toxin-antitoxin module